MLNARLAMSATWGNSENIYSLGVLPPVTQSRSYEDARGPGQRPRSTQRPRFARWGDYYDYRCMIHRLTLGGDGRAEHSRAATICGKVVRRGGDRVGRRGGHRDLAPRPRIGAI